MTTSLHSVGKFKPKDAFENNEGDERYLKVTGTYYLYKPNRRPVSLSNRTRLISGENASSQNKSQTN